MDKPKHNISVIVPIYNVEPYLHRCVDSILQQTYRDFELILVDDGSPDSCGVICDEYAAADARVKVIHKSNGGLSDARNAGLEIAQGEYVAFVDSDDWVAPDYLEQLMTALIENAADISECEILRTEGEETISSGESGKSATFETVAAMEQLIHDGVFHQYVWNKLYRRSVIADIIFPKGKTNEDEFWTYRVFGNAKKVTKISNVLYFYFQRPGSIMGEAYSLKRLDALEAKIQRQAYINAHFPELSLQARLNLFGSCIYAGQMTLRHLESAERKKAFERITQLVKENHLQKFEVPAERSLFWLRLARVSFWGTCCLKNLLNRGF